MGLLKMTILSFKSFEPASTLKPRGIFMAMFNPANYKMEYSFTKDMMVTPGSVVNDKTVSAVNPQKMSFDFLIDGTGANGDERVVLVEIKKFDKLVMPDKKDFTDFSNRIKAVSETPVSVATPENPTPDPPIPEDVRLNLPKLLLLWGTFIFACEIETYTVSYTLFNQLGIPLRATISATFTEVKAPELIDSFRSSEELDNVTNITSFLSTAFTLTNNVTKAVDMARSENLNSLRQNVNIK